MTLIQLEYFVSTANCGSFSQAAEKCFVSQPALSMQIKNLEEELGIVLLDRTRKPIIPTEAGLAVLEQAREVIAAFNHVSERVSELRGEVAGQLRLAVIPTIAPYLLHRFVPDFLVRYPKVDLQIREMTTSEIVEALNRDRIDVAILAGGIAPPEIIETELFNDTFHAYLSTSHPLYERSNIRVEEIDPRRLLLLSEGHCLRNQVLELCQAQYANPTLCSFESGSLETLMRLVDSTNTMTVIPEMAIDFIPSEKRTQVKSLAKGAVSRKIALGVRRTYAKQSLVAALREAILAVVK